ncbi:alpha-2-macroglobulin family protein [Kerstersia sp.]|uniref:alpha-2-macroglobulin family protein n=1 Tax=Kerstersia sp. TaxID=1930783 RepID=UPI003F8DED64
MSFRTLAVALSLAILAACDRTPATQPPAAAGTVAESASASAAPGPGARGPLTAEERAELARVYAGRKLEVLDISEIQQDGGAALAVTFSAPLDPQQKLADYLSAVDQKSGKVDGAWQLSANLMTATLGPLAPHRTLVVTVEQGLSSLGGTRLERENKQQITTRDADPVVGFASSGSLLPTELVDGLPVMALNVDKVNVDFFRIHPDQLVSVLEYGNLRGGMDLWDADYLTKSADLVYSGRFDLHTKPNIRETVLLPLGNIEPLKQPGVYFAVMQQAGSYQYSLPVTLFSLSDIGLSVHRYQDRMLVLTQALAGGKAQSGVEVSVHDKEGKVLASGRTDGHGMLELPQKEEARLVMAHQDGQTTLLRLATSVLDLSEFTVQGPPAGSLNFFMFGPRDLYRPGETVPVNALLRDADGKTVPAQPVAVEVMQPDGNVRLRFTWTADSGGLYQRDLALPADGQAGLWTVQARTGNNDVHTYTFHVEDFMPERLSLALEEPAGLLQPDDDVDFGIEARYLYGAPAGGNRLSGQIYVAPLREAVAALPGYQFGRVDETGLTQTIELEPSVLEDDGTSIISQPSLWREARSPVQVTLQASVQETGGRPVTRRQSVAVWPADRLPGLRVINIDDDGSVDMDALAEVGIVLSDREGKRLAAKGLIVRLVRERRDYYWTYGGSDGWGYRYDEKHFVIEERTIDVEAGQAAQAGFLVEWGPYRVEVEDPDTGMVSSARFWAGYRWQDTGEGMGVMRPDQVALTLDKASYRAGEVAKVTVAPPVAGSGYLLVESSEGPLWWQAIDVPAEGKVFEIPVARDWDRHDLYISALVVRPGERKTLQTPKRAVGILYLPLSRQDRKLSVTLDAPAQMRPERALNTRVQVRDEHGKPVANTHVLLSAVDVGILNITEFKTPDPFTAFFGRKRYGVDQLDIYGRLIEGGNFRQASLAFGGDAASAPGGLPPLTTVRLVSLLAAPAVTNAEGYVDVNVDVPDFNGQLRVMAQVWNDASYGASEAETVVSAPLVAELAAPRFLAGGDRSTLALDLHNLSGAAQDLNVSLAFSGSLAADDERAQGMPLKLADGAKRTLDLPIKAVGGFGQGTVTVKISGLKLPDEADSTLTRQWQIGVRPAVPAQTRKFRAVLPASGEAWTLPANVDGGWQAGGLQAVLDLSSQPPLNVAEQISELIAYPYGCTEQTVSGLYASLYLDQAALRRLGVSSEPDEQRRKSVDTGIQRLLSMQRADGSFGLWSPESPEAHWVTVYATDFLLRAKAQGHEVPAHALEQATRRLQSYLTDGNVGLDFRSEYPGHAIFAVRAYAGSVLARSKQVPLASLRSLFERRDISQSGLPLAHLGLALIAMGDSQRGETALREALDKQRPENYWLNDYGSQLRDGAAILQLMLEAEVLPEARNQLLLSVSELMHDQRWLSTQERASLLLAAVRLDQSQQPRWTATWEAGGNSETISSDRTRGIMVPATDLAGNALTVRNDGATALYASLTLRGYPNTVPQAQDNGIAIRRQYLDLEGRPLNLANVRSGELVLVSLTVRASLYVPDALVVDLLPAGLEPENQNLAHASASLEQAGENVRNLWQQAMQTTITHQEYRDDRYVAALPLSQGLNTHLLYLARAVTPGSYLVPPPFVESMYTPAKNGLGAAPGRLTIKP